MEWLSWEIPVLDVSAVNVAVLLAFAALWLYMRNQATAFDSGSGLDDVIGRGEPVVLEFFGKL